MSNGIEDTDGSDEGLEVEFQYQREEIEFSTSNLFLMFWLLLFFLFSSSVSIDSFLFIEDGVHIF